ncbi:RNA recognition motif 2-domain-containing protein [Rhypophila decipiens]|uniref:RNA recognition motif 2-domain-containing protein n=1 Tax=Rhypophila decipiens TaxID=261697 RepID=A0AAN6YDK8_9PEZI|nr:RNA recognition motif 2-domain-containing protein [Rhypophila decipiens]
MTQPQPRETMTFNPPSPHSSSGGGGDSYQNEESPDTRLTAFSPEGSSTRPNNGMNALTTSNKSYTTRTASSSAAKQSSVERDPFVSNSGASRPEPKLSPTASAFRPVSTVSSVSTVPLVAHGSQSVMPGLGQYYGGLPIVNKLSSELGVSRCLLFRSPEILTNEQVDQYITSSVGGLRGKRHIFSQGGLVYVRFTNIQDALSVHDKARDSAIGWLVDYIQPADFYQASTPGVTSSFYPEGQFNLLAVPIAHLITGFEIQKILQGFLRGHGDVFAFQVHTNLNENQLYASVEFSDVEVTLQFVQQYNGRLLNGISLILSLAQPGLTSMLPGPVESQAPSRFSMQEMANSFQNMNVSNTFQNNNASKTPQTGFQNAIVPAAAPNPAAFSLVPQQQLAMYHHQPVLYQTMPAQPRYLPVMDQTPTRRGSTVPMTPLTPMSSGSMPMLTPIFTPPATPMTMQGEYLSPRGMQAYGRADSRRQNALRVNRSSFHNPGGHHNHVDVNRIRDGIDVRTTIMLRNIPNKVDQAMLKNIIDQSSWGKYDFMYLRIDFANDCNVGYAFINFVDPLDIIDFVNARANQRWNCFKSDKIAEISYATIQGKDCLVQKFRNSSVMLEASHYRPKLYYTVNGPKPELAGDEEPFPKPDNQSKMKRSCENAEHVGLFTPNAGQHFRDEQRRRRSQYDRGTRLAAYEENEYDSYIQQQQPPHSHYHSH